VCRDPARDVHTDGGDLPARRVDASQSLDAKGVDAEVRHGPDQHFFQIANVTVNVFSIGTEINDRVPDDLAQAVISHFSAAVGLIHSHVARS
jgi:hypothetical protein